METVIGVDLGGTKVLIGEMTKEGKVLSSKYYVSDVSSQHHAVQCIVNSLHDFFDTTQFIGKIKGIGIGVVGRVDRKKGEWIEIHPELSEMTCLKKIIEDEFQLHCEIGNDVYCATLSEQVFGLGKKYKNFIYMNIGTGIAARLVIDGNILEGAHFDAGEVGHMSVDMNSSIHCVCGNVGCVETMASGLGLHNCTMNIIDDFPNTCIKTVSGQRVSVMELIDGYESRDDLSQYVLDNAFKAIAVTIMNLIRVSDPEAIILGGGIGGNQWIVDHIKPYLNANTIRFLKDGI